MTVQAYLDQYYWDADKLSIHCGLSVAELRGMITAGFIPKPSYVVKSSVLKSAAFGDLDAQNARDGAYFHPASAVWVAQARNLTGSQILERLKLQFSDNMAAELAILNGTVWRLVDAFDDHGEQYPDGLQSRIDSYWNSFLQGIFGLCVANPATEREIAQKEILQEKLTALTDDGLHVTGIAIGKEELLALIDSYADASMPFSPVEYPISSRKRLVDDLRRKCVAG